MPELNMTGRMENPLREGQTYTTARLKRANVIPSWDVYAKSNCKWEILEIEHFVKRKHGGVRHLAHRVTLKGKPKTMAGTTRKRPIEIERVFHD